MVDIDLNSVCSLWDAFSETRACPLTFTFRQKGCKPILVVPEIPATQGRVVREGRGQPWSVIHSGTATVHKLIG